MQCQHCNANVLKVFEFCLVHTVTRQFVESHMSSPRRSCRLEDKANPIKGENREPVIRSCSRSQRRTTAQRPHMRSLATQNTRDLESGESGVVGESGDEGSGKDCRHVSSSSAAFSWRCGMGGHVYFYPSNIVQVCMMSVLSFFELAFCCTKELSTIDRQ
jgi:hypothetical protein